MIQRFTRHFNRWIRPGCLAAAAGPCINLPAIEHKTRADVRREILGKLSVRMRKLGISKSSTSQ